MAENHTNEDAKNGVRTITTDFSGSDSPFNAGKFSGVDPYFQDTPASDVQAAEEAKDDEKAEEVKDEAPKAETKKTEAPKTAAPKASAPTAPAAPSK
ncbi:hypothetical protein Mbo2_014 [Rhodococcus phage Mbo2]|uniref:Uncharacterized protein n=1 Tax=Rhodococcus phage Mbo2 TaxID=2936911 RepID=A0A9E7IED9_9CAUD|nr:hypothetical protein Mbo2_014 [Rhodococcus phage Mbo2]